MGRPQSHAGLAVIGAMVRGEYGSLPQTGPRRSGPVATAPSSSSPMWAVSTVLVLVSVMACTMLLGRVIGAGPVSETQDLFMTGTEADQDRLERYRVLGVLRALTPDKDAYKKAKLMAIKKLQEFQSDDAKTMGFVHKPFDATGHKKLEAKLLVELNKNATTLEKSEQQELAKKQAKQLEMIKNFP